MSKDSHNAICLHKFPQGHFILFTTTTTKSLQSSPTLCDPIDSSHQAPHPWDSPGKNTEVGCHFLLQCTKVKSGSEVAQSCPTFSDPMDCSPPGSSAHGIFQARVLEWGAILFNTQKLSGIRAGVRRWKIKDWKLIPKSLKQVKEVIYAGREGAIIIF